MESLKKSRRVQRRAFKKLCDEIEERVKSEDTSLIEIEALTNTLIDKFEVLRVLDNEVFEKMIENDAPEQELDTEVDASDALVSRFKFITLLVNKQTSKEADENCSEAESKKSSSSGERKFKLPKLELRKFTGDVREWIPFWSQFAKIDADLDLDDSDKFQYLIQATAEGSRARELVTSYPPTAANYSGAVKALKSRFGRDSVLIEVHVRELLSLVINNSRAGKKLPLATLYDKIIAQLKALETLNVPAEACAAMLYPLVESCLPEDLLRVWERSQTPRWDADRKGEKTGDLDNDIERPSEARERLLSLIKFIQREVENEERIALAMTGFGSSKEKGEGIKDRPRREVATTAGLLVDSRSKCIFCLNDHQSTQCPKALAMTWEDRRKKIFDKGNCLNCLRSGHLRLKCKFKPTCPLCQRGHLKVMCPGASENVKGSDVLQGKDRKVEVSLSAISNTSVILQTLTLLIKGRRETRKVRALLDSGSQRSYISSSLEEELGLEVVRRVQLSHALFGGVETTSRNHKVFLLHVSDVNETFFCNFEALGQDTICHDLPPISVDASPLGLGTRDIPLYDTEPGPIDVLIGADIYGKIVTGDRKELKNGLVAIHTLLGWTIMGKVSQACEEKTSTMVTFNLLNKSDSVSSLWDLETIGIKDPTEKVLKEEKLKEIRAFFNISIKREGNRYVVKLLWKTDHPPLPTNYHLARDRTEKKAKYLSKAGQLKEYNAVFDDWCLEKIIEPAEGEGQHYLPHRPVIKEGSTTRIRPVFDASARTPGNPSLNDCLEEGQNLIELIPNVLTRFRLHRVGVSADIKKAFLQISLDPEERDFLRFFIVNDEGKVTVYRHTRVVFGVCSSPFILGATLDYHFEQCLEENGSRWPIHIIETLRSSFYVDNCLTSVSSREEFHVFRQVASEVLAHGGFDLRGWESSVDDELLEGQHSKVLGLIWDRHRDTLMINNDTYNKFDCSKVTKRKILSAAQRIYDPLGVFTPLLLKPKLLLRDLWEKKVGWDEELEEEIGHEFLRWWRSLPQALDIEVPRWIYGLEEEMRSFHVFVDASETAYACAIFVRIHGDAGVRVNLVSAKTRISPLKEISLPRLELLAATIGARLFNSTVNVLNFGEIDVTFWTDSSTVLAWIQRKENWNVFVRNRVEEIRRLTNPKRWQHIPGALNPADLPSRGCSATKLRESRWWEGPSWLRKSEEHWPKSNVSYAEEEIGKERKNITTVQASVCVKEGSDWYYRRFSKFNKIRRLVGWILRFLHNSRKPQEMMSGELSASESEQAELHIWKMVQKEAFTDIEKQRVAHLPLLVDERGITRVKTRLTAMNDASYHFVNPIILPGNHVVVRRFLVEAHERNLHVGAQGLISGLRQEYWILSGRRSAKSVIKRCIACQRFTARAIKVSEAALPKERVRQARPFEVVGVDLFGPLFLRGGQKAWVCLFTCAVVRALHLELIDSLSTDSFLLTLRRFIARWGRPKTILCDNGSNFAGANRILSGLDWHQVELFGQAEKIDWKFSPPTAPWWGGFWERMVRSVKERLRRSLGNASLTSEEMRTALSECEAVLNSRPLTYVSENPDDLEALTPSHFCKEINEGGTPDLDAVDALSLRRRLRYRQNLRQRFWRRFVVEYLGNLRPAQQLKSEGTIRVGQLVLIGNDNQKRLQWPLARVLETFPGKDSLTRVVRVKTAQGEFLRPAARLYPLEMDITNLPESDLLDLGESWITTQRGTTGELEANRGVETEGRVQGFERSHPNDSCGSQQDLERAHPERTTRSGRVVNAPSKLDL